MLRDKITKRIDEIKADLESEGMIFVIRPEKQIPVERLQNDPQVLEKVYCQLSIVN